MPRRSELRKMVESCARTRRIGQVWDDWIHMCAIALRRGQLDGAEQREADYLRIAGRYTDAQVQTMAEALGQLVSDMDAEVDDHLGKLFMELEISSDPQGQFFTPLPVARMMADVSMPDIMKAVEERGHATVDDCACGSGVMLLAAFQQARAAGLNPQTQLWFHGTDKDPTCARMAFIQLSLIGAPAVIVHGDTLSLDEWDVMPTLWHIAGGWGWRLRRPAAPTVQVEQPEPVDLPTQDALFEEAS